MNWETLHLIQAAHALMKNWENGRLLRSAAEVFRQFRRGLPHCGIVSPDEAESFYAVLPRDTFVPRHVRAIDTR